MARPVSGQGVTGRPPRRAHGADSAVLALSLDRDGAGPLHVQLAAQLRGIILAGRVAPGARLPSSRALAVDLGIARATAVLALEQLAAEGYVEGRRGAGIFVSAQLPEQVLQAPGPPPPAVPPPRPAAEGWLPFHLDATDIALFPREAWSRLLQRSWREHGAAMLGPPDAFGWPPLRAAIARHLQAWRGIPGEAGRIVVTSGISDAMEIIAAIAFRPGERVLVEDPGFPLIRHGLARLGLVPVPGLVDQQGLDVARALGGEAGRDLRGVFVAPSRHYPLGATLPIGRRLALLDWAATRDGLVVEDDYDGEYRYVGAPLPALSGLDRGGRVVYVGSFSKVLSRALRLGFLVLPERLVPAARAHLARRGASAGIVAQPALAGFIASGEFAAHIRRTRRIYARRLQALLEAGRRWSGVIEVQPTESGMHALARLGPSLPASLTDREAAALALAAGVVATPLSTYATRPADTRVLLLGFAAFREEALAAAMDRLGAALSRAARRD